MLVFLFCNMQTMRFYFSLTLMLVFSAIHRIKQSECFNTGCWPGHKLNYFNSFTWVSFFCIVWKWISILCNPNCSEEKQILIMDNCWLMQIFKVQQWYTVGRCVVWVSSIQFHLLVKLKRARRPALILHGSLNRLDLWVWSWEGCDFWFLTISPQHVSRLSVIQWLYKMYLLIMVQRQKSNRTGSRT